MHDLSDILLGLTALERWGATRRINPRSEPQGWFVLVGLAVLAVLLVLLVTITARGHQPRRRPTGETFADNARRRGLGARERQILLAVAQCSGLQNAYDVFHEIQAFREGMARLLAECARTRTPQEVEALQAELSRLEQKLGFQKTAGFSPSRTTRGPDRRRFPRVAVRWPALIAPWPLVRRSGAAEAVTPADAEVPGAADADLTAYVPTFEDSTVTELAGSGLRLETRLQVQVDDRILVIFPVAEELGGAPAGCRIVTTVGRVKHGRNLEYGTRIPDAIDHVWNGSPQRDFHALAARPWSVAVELTDLDDEEIGALASLARALSARARDPRAGSGMGPGEPAAHMAVKAEHAVATGAGHDE